MAVVVSVVAQENEDERWVASAGLRFEPVEGETVADLATSISEAYNFALLAGEPMLAQHADWGIQQNLADARLIFFATGATEDEAEENAERLRKSFLEIDPTVGIAIDVLLDEYEQEAAERQLQIDEVEPSLTPEEEATLRAIERVEAEISAIDSRLIALSVARAAVLTSEDAANLETEINNLEARLESLEAQRRELGPVPEATSTPEEALLLATLRRRMELLTSQYERLYLRQLGVSGDETPEAIISENTTVPPIQPVLAAALGLVGGLLIGIFTVMFLARTRGTVWLAADVGVPVLGEVPARQGTGNLAEPWYDSAEPGPRKTAIQAMRSAVEAQIPAEGATIAITRYEADTLSTQTLAADLAASMASAGTKVLVIDADFASRTGAGAVKVGGTTLADVLKLSPSSPLYGREIQQAAEDAYNIRDGLAVIPSGPPPSSPGDALAGRQFRSLLAACQSRYDTVIVVVDAIETPEAQVAMQRVGSALLAITPGEPTIAELDGLIDEARRLRISVLGAVFVGRDRFHSRRSRRSGGPSRASAVRVESSETTVQASPISRLQNYPIPDERRSSAIEHSALRGLVDGVGGSAADNGVGLGVELTTAIDSAAPETAYAAVAEYLVSRTEDMLTAKYGFGGFTEDLIHEVSELGFMTLKPMRGCTTVGEWIKREIGEEVDSATGAQVVDQIEAVISAGVGEPMTMDRWLNSQFFRRHAIRRQGEPEVWHLSSPERTVSILVTASRLSPDRLEILMREVGSRALDEIHRRIDSAEGIGDTGLIGQLKSELRDVEAFQHALERLLDGVEDSKGKSSGGWLPDWSKGMRANLAAIQEVGLLPYPLLDEDIDPVVAVS